MARARNIKPSIYKNELLGQADPLLTVLFTSLWCLADREGRLEDRPLRIKAETFPYRENLDINGYLTELQRLGFIRRYVVEGIAYIQVVNFTKHQTPHNTEKPSVIPKEVVENQYGESITVKPPLKNDALPAPLPPDSLIPDSRILIPESTPAPQKPGRQNVKGRKHSLPNGFVISDRVRVWAVTKGFDRLDEHFESFVRKCRAKNYQYADWDEGFMGAITDDWAKLQPLRVGQSSKTASALMSLEGMKHEPTGIQHRNGERPSEVAGFIPAKHASG